MGMKKNILLCILVLMGSFAFSEIQIEVPMGLSLGISEIPLDSHESYSMFLPYIALGPVRGRYVFDSPASLPKLRFAAGASFVPWPFQLFAASGSAFFTLKEFQNRSSLELCNTLDLGILLYPVTMYDVTDGVNKSKVYLSHAALYTLDLFYRFPKEKVAYYLGGGFNVGNALLYGSDFFLYAVHLTFGIYF